jgi:hypothetical protein
MGGVQATNQSQFSITPGKLDSNEPGSIFANPQINGLPAEIIARPSPLFKPSVNNQNPLGLTQRDPKIAIPANEGVVAQTPKQIDAQRAAKNIPVGERQGAQVWQGASPDIKPLQVNLTPATYRANFLQKDPEGINPLGVLGLGTHTDQRIPTRINLGKIGDTSFAARFIGSRPTDRLGGLNPNSGNIEVQRELPNTGTTGGNQFRPNDVSLGRAPGFATIGIQANVKINDSLSAYGIAGIRQFGGNPRTGNSTQDFGLVGLEYKTSNGTKIEVDITNFGNGRGLFGGGNNALAYNEFNGKITAPDGKTALSIGLDNTRFRGTSEFNTQIQLERKIGNLDTSITFRNPIGGGNTQAVGFQIGTSWGGAPEGIKPKP